MMGVNETLVKLIFEEPIEDYTILDVGCGSGALTFTLAKRAKRVIGIDISKDAIEEAKKIAGEKGYSNTSFYVMDADRESYKKLGGIDMVVSHLCMSNDIVRNSFNALPMEGVFAFACFHADHLIEGGRRSRFSYTKDEMKKILVDTGFVIEYLEVEKEKIPFKDFIEAEKILGPKRVKK